MIEQEQPDVFGYTVFCDDIRQETTGKLIYIGVYHERTMVVHGTFPLTLPRLSFAISTLQKIGSVSPTIKIRVFAPGDPDDAPSIEAEAPVAQDEADLKANLIDVPEAQRKFVTMTTVMQFDNFQLKEPGLIRVKADIGDKRYSIGSLRITAAPKSP